MRLPSPIPPVLLTPLLLLVTLLTPLACGGKVVIDQGAGGNNVSSGTGDPGNCTGIPNDCCTTATDVTKGGSFKGTTCGADTTFQSTGQCGKSAPDAFFKVNPGLGFYTYYVEVTEGFYVMATTEPADNCKAPSQCPFEGNAGLLSGSLPFYIAIQRTDGGCGAFEVTFELVQ